jgi:exopolysaccharide production protein ExoQ
MNQSIQSRIPTRVRVYNRRQSWDPTHAALSRPTGEAIVDRFAILPIAACVFALIVAPLFIFFTDHQTLVQAAHAAEARPETRIFWPAIAAISVILAAQNRSRLMLAPHMVCLFAYLAFAGASVLWALSPYHSFIRYLQQVMIITTIVLPVMLAARTVDIMRALFLCFAFALILNCFFVFVFGYATMATSGSSLVAENIGYQGYFEQKNILGESAVPAFLLSLYEIRQRGSWRRAVGVIIAAVAILIVNLSQSKTSFGLALISPLIAWLTLRLRKITHISPAIILLIIPLCYVALSFGSSLSMMQRISWYIYHDYTLTGRTTIWDFAQYEIGRRPLFGWGYQSFWLVPGSPVDTDAKNWVKILPTAHNGYFDTMLEMGYAGLAFLLVFILGTLHAVGHVADRDASRAQLLLSLVLFFILYNFLESLWMKGFEFLWVMFVIVAAEIGRYWRPFPLRRAAYSSRRQKPGSGGASRGAGISQLGMTLS